MSNMKQALLGSFFLGGFESTTGFNSRGQWIDQIVATQHDIFLNEDYGRLKKIGIKAAREAVRWPLVDVKGHYDFSTVRPVIEASKKHGIDIIYDLFHFGFPRDIDLIASGFPERFTEYCYAVARFIAANSEGPFYFTPINEPSYFSWAAGEVALFAPYLQNLGFELKVNLARAAIRGIEAIWDACPEARIVNVDSLCRIVPCPESDDQEATVHSFNSGAVFQSWDILSGRMNPELGGSLRHLDIVGVNYYWTNQWEFGRPNSPLTVDDPRRWSLRQLLRSVWERYGTEMILTETAHRDEMRGTYFRELSGELPGIFADHLPLRGICLYPILGMPEWHDQQEWARMGVWDLVFDGPTLRRVPYLPLIEALGETQKNLDTLWNECRSAKRAGA